ncbi:centromere protein U [Rhynchocyon petersi]
MGVTRGRDENADRKHKPPDVFEFPDNSDVSSIGRLDGNEQDEELYETFAPLLHSTAIYADEEEFSKQVGSVPSTPPGKAAGRSHEKSDVTSKDREADKEKTCSQEHEPVPATASSELPEKARPVTPEKIGPLNAQPTVEEEACATDSQQKARKKRKMPSGKGKKSRRQDAASDGDIPESAFIWCLEGKKTSDIMELDIVLSAFEKTFLEYKQKLESRTCKEAVNTFHSNIKEELIQMIKDVQLLKNLKRKNAKMISGIEKKRQRLIEVQDELLRLEPQLKQLQTKYDGLMERKSSLKDAAYLLSNLKQLHQDYSSVREKEPEVKETYDSSSLPALLLKARGLLGAEAHLRNINQQLEVLLDQD